MSAVTPRPAGSRSRRWLMVALAGLLAAAAAVAPAAGASTAGRAERTPYPGGRWQPPPPSYGVVAVRNVPVRMDDGVDVVADVYYPADARTGRRATGRFPVLLTQTPYTNSTGLTTAASTAGPGDFFVQRGYIFVSADVRGTGRSGGNGGFFSPRDARDGVDLVDWVAHRLAGSNGVVGLTGCSYLGQTQLYTAALLGPHSPVKAMIPACVSGDIYRDTYLENGIPSPAWDGAGLAAGTLLGPTIETYLLPRYLASQQDNDGQAGDTAYDRQFWTDRDHLAQAPAIVRSGIPALLWDGWIEPGFGALELYAALQNAHAGRSPWSAMRPDQPVTGRYQLIVGDWTHGGGLDDGIMLEWYDTWLRHRDTGLATTTRTPIHLQELGSDRWVDASVYPFVSRYTRYFLDRDGTLAGARPRAAAAATIVWAPPAVTGSTLTYASAPFPRGATVAGPAAVTVYASSDTTDLELMADLYDVAPDGTSTLISHGGILGSLHTTDQSRSWTDTAGLPTRPFLSLTRDDYVPPGQLTRYDIPLQPTVWALRPGHALRLRLATQPEPQRCEQAMAKVVWPVIGCKPRPAIAARLAGSHTTVVNGGAHASAIDLPIMPYEWLHAVAAGTTPTSAGVILPQAW